MSGFPSTPFQVGIHQVWQRVSAPSYVVEKEKNYTCSGFGVVRGGCQWKWYKKSRAHTHFWGGRGVVSIKMTIKEGTASGTVRAFPLRYMGSQRRSEEGWAVFRALARNSTTLWWSSRCAIRSSPSRYSTPDSSDTTRISSVFLRISSRCLAMPAVWTTLATAAWKAR
jgi:hypothetical protein